MNSANFACIGFSELPPVRLSPTATSRRYSPRLVSLRLSGYPSQCVRSSKGSGRVASADDRKETSLRACVAYMLGIDASEVPTKREANLGQWLALRNLGLVPVASNRNLGRYLHRNVWQHPSSRLQGTLGHDTVSFQGLSVRPRTHDENLKTR